MSDNIKVAIKVRPLIKREKDERLPIQWTVEENSIIQIDPETKKKSDAGFQFDYIFDMGQTNQDVFDATAKPIVEAAMKGFNGTIFAYGQTGSGKTYTMMGTKQESGVIPLTVNYIFNYIRNDPSREFLLRVSYIEIYNEKINDLLDKNKIDLKVKEDYCGHISIDCKEEITNSPEAVLHAMRKGDKNRRTGETNMNERSSRSHTIFRIFIESCEKTNPDETAKEAQLNLIDLAGSERARQTGATGERFNEGRHINLSLSTLSLVIKQLSESQTYINYRDSKLTRILQSSLGGNALTTIICAVTPAADDETQCTLAFAVRAKGIKNKPQINENISDKALLKRIKAQKATLEAELEKKKTELLEKDKLLLRGRIQLMNVQILSSNQQNDRARDVHRRRTWAGTSICGTNNSLSKNLVLPTIDECEQKSDDEMDELIKQQDIYEMNIDDKFYRTAFADFELQLIEDQRENNRLSSDSCSVPPTVTRRQGSVDHIENINICSPERTPERKHGLNNCGLSPGTPKNKLREKLENLREEYDKLREFTTLEKQLLQTDCIAAANQAQYNEDLAYVTRSLTDSEHLCKDLNKKYSELLSDHAILKKKYDESTQNCEILRQEVESLSSLRDTVTSLEIHNDDYKLRLNTALQRQKNLEDEIASHEFELESLKTKHKSREKELEGSLNLAWQDFIDPNEKQKLTDVVHLQSVVAELTAIIKSRELQSNANTESTSVSENDFKLKIDELNNLLTQSRAENLLLTEKLSQTAELIDKCNDTPLINELNTKIAKYTQRIDELEKKIVEKDSELFGNNHELLSKLSEANDKLKVDENRINTMESDIEKLQSDLCEKINELGEIKLRLNVTLEESEKTSRETQLQLNANKEQLEAAFLAIKTKELEIEEMKQIFEANKNQLQICNEPSDVNKNQSVISENESTNSVIIELTSQLEERNCEITKQEKIIQQLTADFTSTIKSLEDKINELLITNDKLRDQIANKISEKTMFDSEKAKMTIVIEEKDDQLKLIPKLQNELEFAMSEKTEFERIMNDLRTQLNEKVLEAEKMSKYESEMNNLNSYNVNLQSFVKELQDENEKIKKELENEKKTIKLLKSEKKSLISELDLSKITSSNNSTVRETSRCENSIIMQNTTIIDDVKSSSRVCQIVKPLNISESPMNENKTQVMNKNVLNVTCNDKDKESSSIFANVSYFENMDVSSVATNEFVDSAYTQNLSTADFTLSNITVTESKLEDSKKLLNITCDELDNCLSGKNMQELVNIIKELFNLKITLEEENAKLLENLRSKIHEATEIKNDLGAFKLGVEKLQQIEINSQTHIDELEKQLEIFRNEKQTQEENMKMLQEEINNLKDSAATIHDRKITEISEEYEKKIATLMDTNIELSNNLKEKIEELEKMKNEKSNLCGDDCKNLDRCNHLAERVGILENENVDLFNNLMAKIKELDNISEKYEILNKNTTNNESSPECVDNCEHRIRCEHLAERVEILENENVDLSDKLTAKITELDSISEKYEILNENTMTKSKNCDELLEKINALVNLVEELKILNTKLPDLKLMFCQCAQQTELHETRCAIKNNMKLLNNQLHEFQQNFERVRAEAEKLTNKANEDVNISTHDTSMNISISENTDISFVEAKIHQLQEQYETMHNNLQEWSVLSEKPNDCEKLRDNNTSIHEISRQSFSDSPKISKRGAKIDRCQNELEKYKIEQQQLTKTLNAFEKFQNDMIHMQHEIKNLRTAREMYKEKISRAEISTECAEERVKNLEEEIITMSEQLDQVHGDNKKLYEFKLTLEKEIENLKSEKNQYEEMVNDLRKSLLEAKDIEKSLQNKLEEFTMKNDEESSTFNDKLEEYKSNLAILDSKIQSLEISLQASEDINNKLKSELDLIKSTPSEREQVMKLTETLQSYKNNVETLEISVKDLREKLSFYEKENTNLTEQVMKLQTAGKKLNLNMSDNKMEICDESFTEIVPYEKIIEEMTETRARIIKEIATLQKTEVDKFKKNSLSELFGVFLTTLMAKEHEMMKTLLRRNEREKQELIEQNKQSIDAEKRSNAWAKVLETDIERLQNDLTNEKEKNKTLSEQISRLKNSLMDSDHENQLLKEKMAVMETDFNALQADYEKYTKNDSRSDSALNEKWLQNAMENREIEYKMKIAKVETEHKVKIDELSYTLETVKTKNIDLKRELEAVEANERQSRSIIDLKTNEITKLNSTIQRLQNELKDQTEIYNQTNDDNQTKNQKIEEITALLKAKCDKMSEYKNALQTITPEYEMLKVQATERQLRLETYKSELEKLRDEKSKNMLQISSLKDQLDLEEIKSAGLNKQLADIMNRNTILQSELEQLGEKCRDLERENERFVKRIRQSTSKLTAEREMEDLRDENREHLKNLEGASNRIIELQKHKTQLMKDHVELQGRYELICQENNEMKKKLNKNNNINNDTYELRDKYDALIQEKNRIALELEDKRSKLMQYEMQIESLTKTNIDLQNKNTELDAEMDEIVKKIHEMDEENTELQRKIYAMEDENDNTKNISTNNSSLIKLQKHYETIINERQSVIDSLKKQNAELKYKNASKNEGRSSGSSRNTSPTPLNRSRQRRSDLFNQNRSLEVEDNAEVSPIDCQCEQLRKQIILLEREVVAKKAKIGTLQMQIESEMFPYKSKCSELEEIMLSYQEQNRKLLSENNTLRLKKIECERCMNLRSLKREQGTQMSPKKQKIFLSGYSGSGIIEEHVMEHTKIKKLETDKHMLKTKLHLRLVEMSGMKKKIKELESQLGLPHISDTNHKYIMKENVPINITGQTKLQVSQQTWFN